SRSSQFACLRRPARISKLSAFGYSNEAIMPLYIKDDATAELVSQLARLRGVTKQEAVRTAVKAELDRVRAETPLRVRLAKLWEAHPMPEKTGAIADKGFFDALSDDL